MEHAQINETNDDVFPPGSRALLLPRLVIGLVQGLLLYWLLDAAHAGDAFTQHTRFFFPLLLIVYLLPPVAVIGLRYQRPLALLATCTALAAIVAILGLHDAWRETLPPTLETLAGHKAAAAYPSFHVILLAGVLVNAGYVMLLAGLSARAWLAPYESYFALSWKLFLQIALSSLFGAVFNLVLLAGAALFLLIKVDVFLHLLMKPWVYFPFGTAAFAFGLHLTDVRPAVIRGMRTLLLTLLSWLLPLLVVIVAGFLGGTLASGFSPLWEDRSTAGVLLGVAFLLVLFMTAVFKNGAAAEPVPFLLRLSARAGALALVALVLEAGYALALRIDEYGLSERRVVAAALVLVAGCYAVGYAWAALDRKGGLRAVAPTNVLTAYVSLALLFALLTPLADPDRLAVNEQVGRLLSGRTAPDQFDYVFLHLRSSAYGRQALARLQSLDTGPNAARIRELSREEAVRTPRESHDRTMTISSLKDPEAATRNIVMGAPGQVLPDSFVHNDWQHLLEWPFGLPQCMSSKTDRCDGYLVDFSRSGKPDVVLIPSGDSLGTVFGENAAGKWRVTGHLHIGSDCAGVRRALSQGSYRLAAPVLNDIEVNGQRIAIDPEPRSPGPCKP